MRRGVADVDESYLKEDTVTLGISFNGKTRFTLDFPADASKETIERRHSKPNRAKNTSTV